MRISYWMSDLCSADLVEVCPVNTNSPFLSRASADPDFRAGEVDTAFLPSKIDSLVPDATPADAVWNLAAEAMLASDFGGRSDASDPWRALQGFRANGGADLRVALRHGGETRTIEVGDDRELAGVATANGDTMLVFAEGQAFAFTLPGMGGGRSEEHTSELQSIM